MPGKYVKIRVDDKLGDSSALHVVDDEIYMKKIYLNNKEYPYIYFDRKNLGGKKDLKLL